MFSGQTFHGNRAIGAGSECLGQGELSHIMIGNGGRVKTHTCPGLRHGTTFEAVCPSERMRERETGQGADQIVSILVTKKLVFLVLIVGGEDGGGRREGEPFKNNKLVFDIKKTHHTVQLIHI